MNDVHGLPSLNILAATEVWNGVTLQAATSGVPSCPKCGKDAGVTLHCPWNAITVLDVPSRGRPCKIVIDQDRYRCKPCNKSFVGRPSDVHPSRLMTRRLIRYIENSSFRRPRTKIAKEVGASVSVVDSIVEALANRLAAHHRFPAPAALGMDDLLLNDKTYTVFTDAETGHAIGIIDSGDKDVVGRWVRDNIMDRSRVKVFASDLGGTNIAIAKTWFPDAIHVADKWHVLRYFQKAMSRIIARQLRELDADAIEQQPDKARRKKVLAASRARHLRGMRRELLGRRVSRRRDAQLLFDLDELRSVLTCHIKISRVFYVRIRMLELYQAEDVAEAQGILTRVRNEASHRDIAVVMAPVLKMLRTYEPLILNYVRARLAYPSARGHGYTTSAVERRNGFIRGSWQAGRGVTRLNYLRMLALYQPWDLDVDIVECGRPDCDRIEGPVGLVALLTGQPRDGALLPPTAFRCSVCAAAGR